MWLRPSAYASGVRASNRSTGAICPNGTVLTPRVKPEDDDLRGWSVWLRPFAYASGVRASNRSTGAICPDGTVLTPRVEPEDDEGKG